MVRDSLILVLIPILVVTFTLSGCATSPDKISASYVSPLQYSNLSCQQIQAEMRRVSAKAREVAGVQRGEATKDAWALGIGFFLFWPALFFMMGSDKKEELARLKGEYEALEKAGIRKNCGFVEKMKKIREKKKKELKKKKKEKQQDKEDTQTQNFAK